MSEASETLALRGRVKLLEAALRKVMKRYKHGSTWAKVCEDALSGKHSKPEPMLRDFRVEDGALEMTIEESTGLVHRMAEAMCHMLDHHKAKNYLQESVSVGTSEFVLLLQRRNGKTPHELREEAEARLSAAVANEREGCAQMFDSAQPNARIEHQQVAAAIRARGDR